VADVITLEQELEQLIEASDYRVSIYAGDNYLKLKLFYLPKTVVKGQDACPYVANGIVAENHWIMRNSKRRWRKARRWVEREIAGHRELLRTVGQA
jgi:hypothetical protein